MRYFLLFMGWIIVYSLFYFTSLNIAGVPPGGEETTTHKIINYGVLFALSFPVWWLTWKRFEKAFGGLTNTTGKDDITIHHFALRRPALNYYLMVLKFFLLALGLNGILTLSRHQGGARVFYIINFIVLYAYALPFLFIKGRKLRKASQTKLARDDSGLRLMRKDGVVVSFHYSAIESVAVEESTQGILIQGQRDNLYLGGQKAKGSSFWLAGFDQVWASLMEKAGDKSHPVESIKTEMKNHAFKPTI